MWLWHQISQGLATLFGRARTDQDLAEEMSHFLAEAEADLMAGGATRAEARRAVRLQHGDGLPAREMVRAYGWETGVEALITDVRLTVRRLRRSPGFTAVVVLTLGLGVGTATAIFSAVSPVLFTPLAYPDADRVLSIAGRSADGAPFPIAFGTYLELSTRSQAFEALSVFKPWQPTVTGAAEPEQLDAQLVTAGYFDVLGVGPVLGRGFEASADRPGGIDVVILSDDLWRRRFAADPGVVGQTVLLDAEAYVVVGVMPADFENATAPRAEAWSLLQYDPLVVSFDTREWGNHLDMVVRVRLALGVDGARRELQSIAERPDPAFARPDHASLATGLLVRRLRDAATAGSRPAMLVLLGAVALLLVIACANLTILLLARGSRRRGELAMRVALGADRGRLLRYLLTESLVLAGMGGAVGIVVARFGLAGLVALSPPSLPRIEGVGLDGAALGFALGITTIVGVIFGLAPAMARTGEELTQSVRDAGRGSVGRNRAARRALVVTEVAMAVVLLIGAGLLLRSSQRLFSIPTGFDASGKIVMQVHATGLERGDAVTHQFFDRALDAVRDVPGVTSAAMTSQLPLSGDIDGYGITLDEPGQEQLLVASGYRYAVADGYFETMGITLLRGRALERQDEGGAPPVAVVSESLAVRLFPGGDPLGRRIGVGDPSLPPFTIVGVVGDVKQESLGTDDADAVYVTPQQWHWADRVRWIVVKADSDPMALAPAIRQAVWSVDNNQPIVRTQSLADLVQRSEAQRRFVLTVLMAFALSALTLAGVGLYGVLAGTVTERMREMGVRAALGASQENILALVVGQGMTLTAIGVTVGLVGAAAASTALTSLLFGVSRLDPTTYVGVVVLLTLVSAVACLIPAVRAARVDPLTTLRADG